MSIKRIFIVISAIFAASAVFADNSSVTSKKYVDDLMSGYQGKLPGSGANTLMIYDNSEDGIGEKSIETTLVSNATGVPTVGAVKTGLDGKQDTITGTAGYVMTGTGNPGEVGAKPIYSANTNYSDSLVTAETVNTGVINAVNSSLIRVDEDGTPDSNGTLWKISDALWAINANVPYGYTELQYISSGTDGQYIDTGILFDPTKNFRVVGSFINPDASARKIILGNYYNQTSTTYYSVELYNDGTFRNYLAVTSSLVTSMFSPSRLPANTLVNFNTYYNATNHTITNSLSYNGTVQNYSAATVSPVNTAVYSLKLFNDARAGVPALNNAITLGIIEIYENGVLIHKFVPAKNSSDVVGMYDTVSGAFFTDAAGGNFIAGPAVVGN